MWFIFNVVKRLSGLGHSPGLVVFFTNSCKVCCFAYTHTCLLLVYPRALFDLQLKISHGTLTMLTHSCSKLILNGLAKEVDVANVI